MEGISSKNYPMPVAEKKAWKNLKKVELVAKD